MIVSFEINILCENDNCNGLGASGIFTSTPRQTPDIGAAVAEAERQGWRIDGNPADPKDFIKAICPDCVQNEAENT